MHNSLSSQVDLIVVGGGLAGLSAAALASRTGQSVQVFEKASYLGGRAGTSLRQGVHFNFGPHALYRSGAAFRVLQSLGVAFEGDLPEQGDALLGLGGGFHPWPMSFRSLVRSKLFSWREKFELTRLERTLGRVDAGAFQNISVADWVRQFAGTGNLARLLHTLFRLTTFVNNPTVQSAGSAIEQFQLGQKGSVWYVSRGWQSLVDGLRQVAQSSGAEILSSTPVGRIECTETGVGVILQNGDRVSTRSVIVATPPAEAAQLLDLPDAHVWRQASTHAIPARAACLDIALEGLPRPRTRFALGLDEPVYYSVHSGPAKLGPEGVAVLHVMRYLEPDQDGDRRDVERELESILDQLQPGWRELVCYRRFLPKMTVTGATPTAAAGGVAGRAPVICSDLPGVYLAGDWVGATGQLADAAVASAEQAVEFVISRQSSPRTLERVG